MSENLEKYLPQVYRFSLRLARHRESAEDLTHDTFVRALEKSNQLRNSKTARSWLFRIATNLWADRQRAGGVSSVDIAECSVSSDAIQVDEQFDRNESQQEVLRCLNRLPERQRAVLHLHAVEDMTTKEIAEVIGITCENVRVHLHHARQAMIRKLPDLSEQYNKADR